VADEMCVEITGRGNPPCLPGVSISIAVAIDQAWAMVWRALTVQPGTWVTL
jgi:hypothetical protein